MSSPIVRDVTPVFRNETENDKHILTLSGTIANFPFFEDGISSKAVKNSLDNVDKDIVIRLNSGGGDVFEGIEIYNYLKSLSNHITIEVTALAASAASLVAMAADKIIIRTGANMMVHEASTMAFGNKSDIQKTL
ncbi:ATP-dependent Clp protease proteolytic subunit, partial [Staphylococcus haemolyticus]|uniref:ATP-dependent Clp protease proteolytic subunit n=2 Tax=Staphylococcus TaxID=1279 RepID=UPI0015D77922